MAGDDLLSSDRALLDGYRQGERAALTRVFRAYAKAIAATLRSGVVVDVDGVATRCVGSLPEAEIEALLQETFTRAFSETARASYDGLHPFGAYLATVARNLLIDRARAAKRAAVLVEPAVLDLAPATGPDPEEQLVHDQLWGIVARVREALQPREARVLAARYERNLSLRDTAEDLQMPFSTVRRVDARVRKTLLSALQRAGYFADR